MDDNLKVSFPQRCSGCELCVLEAQRQLGKVGLNGALIRIFRKGVTFCVDLDPHVSKLEVSDIFSICPRGVFTLEEEDSDAQLIG